MAGDQAVRVGNKCRVMIDRPQLFEKQGKAMQVEKQQNERWVGFLGRLGTDRGSRLGLWKVKVETRRLSIDRRQIEENTPRTLSKEIRKQMNGLDPNWNWNWDQQRTLPGIWQPGRGGCRKRGEVRSREHGDDLRVKLHASCPRPRFPLANSPRRIISTHPLFLPT